MTLRELINQVTNNQMDLSEPFAELDYELDFEIYLTKENDRITGSTFMNNISKITCHMNEKVIQVEIKR